MEIKEGFNFLAQCLKYFDVLFFFEWIPFDFAQLNGFIIYFFAVIKSLKTKNRCICSFAKERNVTANFNKVFIFLKEIIH